MFQEPTGNLLFASRGPFGPPLGGLLGRLLEASLAVWRPSWASWTDRSATRGPLGLSWRPLG
eukprot:8242046-Pyramimonas_sp.AAC.1